MMASGRSKHKLSDETFDYNCTNCAEDNLTKEGIKYCVECQRYFCHECVTAHKRILKGHTLLDCSVGPLPGQQSSLPSFPTEQCTIHKGKILDMYCGNHKIVCCYVCVAKDHTSCDIHSIADDIDKLYKKSDTDRTKHDLTNALDSMDEGRNITQVLLQQLRDSKASAFQAVKDYRAEIDKYLDTLEDASIKDIEREYRKMESELLEERKTYETAIEELKKLEDLLLKAEGNTPQLFVCTNLARHKITSAEYECTGTRKTSVEMSFNPTGELRQLIHGLTSLGKSSVKTTSSEKYLYKAKLIETLDVKLLNEPEPSVILGSCVIDDTLLLTDFSNKKLKRFDVNTLNVEDSCRLDDHPNGVCRVGACEVAVACLNTIQFVSVNAKLVATRKLEMKHTCYGIAYKNDYLYITDGGLWLYMHDMSGKILKTVSCGTLGQPRFQSSNHIVFSDSGDRIFVGDDQLALVCFDANCEHYMTIKDPLAKADGVCVDGRGNVIVAARWSDCIGQFSQDGKKRGVIVSSLDCLESPRSLCFHQGLNRLFVSYHHDKVQVYQLR